MPQKLFIMQAKLFLSIVFSFLFAIGSSQTNDTGSPFNLSFEDVQNGNPQGWHFRSEPDYTVSLDSVIVKSGKYSMSIEFTGDSVSLQTVVFTLPNDYDGKRMTLSGYIKTENVTNGYAGLWMWINPIALNNMQRNGITGTTDWKKSEITLAMNPGKTKRITLGGLLFGKGKMWLDDLQITIDGKDISEATLYEFLPADKDNEFDDGSNIVFPELNEPTINDLELLGRIWGFLKYHHPEVGKGNYNWDYELFRMLPEYLTITDMAQRDEMLLRWIEQYGDIPECETCEETAVDAFLKPDLSWVDDSNMHPQLKEKMHEVYRNRHQGEHYYKDYLQFLNEYDYKNMPYPDAGFRLLALYRYWNMIHYYFPYKHLTDKNWNEVLKEYIPTFVLAATELEYELAVLQLIGEVNDTHANLLGGGDKIDLLRGNRQAPFQVKFIEDQLVVTDYYKPELKDAAGLNVGDVITHINGNRIESIVDSIRNYYPASNEAARMRNIAKDMLRSRDRTLQINYISSGQVDQKELTLYERRDLFAIPKDSSLCYQLLNDSIGYITLKTIKTEDVDEIKKTFRNTKGIIIDIRNYPSAFVSHSLGSYFVSNRTPFVKFALRNIDNPGEFTFAMTYEIPDPEETYQGKLVVIVNEETQSAAEFVAMAFRVGDNTTIIGSQTAGADGDVSNIALPGGLRTRISGAGIYYPDGRETQRVGIVPDIEVKPTIKGIREGRDELLEKAIEIIQQQ